MSGIDDLELVHARLLQERAAVQAFFEALNAETFKPHCSDQVRDIYRNLLKRAQEARIYTPEVP